MEATPEKNLARVLEKLSALHPKKIDLSLGRMTRLLSALGNPETKLPPVIHVAGTNGKGSTIAFLRAILEAAGLSVHVYTSPHLVSFRERIRLNGTLISEDKLIAFLECTEKANAAAPITFFEVTTAAAFLAFAETPADVLLLEVGLGGRLDATNVIERPLVSIITAIDQDHAEFLGTDLKGIAREKAGIMKRGVPVAASPQNPEVEAVLRETAEKIGASLVFSNEKTTVPPLALLGPHQLENARTALTALALQNQFIVSKGHIERGLKAAFWPARLQGLDPRSLGLKSTALVTLDGGHNPNAGRALAAVFQDKNAELFVILGMMQGKDAEGFLAPLKPAIQKLAIIPIPGQDNCRDPKDLLDVAKRLGIPGECAGDLKAALQMAENFGARDILITGSLYLSGHVLALAGSAPK